MPTTVVNQRQDYAYISSEFSTLEYKDDSDNWIVIPGVQDMDVSGTNSPTRDVIGANASAQKRVGIVRVPDLTFNALYLPTDTAWRYIREAQLDRTNVTFRYTTNGERIFKTDETNGAEVSIVATTGATTFANGTGQDAPTYDGAEGVGRGAVIVTPAQPAAGGSQKQYIISNVDPDTNVITSLFVDQANKAFVAVPSGDALSDVDDFAIYSPAPHRWTFVAQVVQGANISMGAEAEMTTTLVLSPRKPLRDPVIPSPVRLVG